ncbi:zinc finger CCCH domain-containing protein 3-like isoform X2 [Nicotiana tabacum]|uniref:Zinc finger CCCH domain-containing protein 3-like isoform X2 n=2 Tax=Nicotiana TaxID=4085 RepID=A0AC58RLS5_TOBAC|nr:PREDICTED: zinc finger CCCH domain-containing protein 3 isoform X3 [Nicotiana sylvestris]
MPLGKYYCDYCDKEFQDTAAARKRHLQGVQHQRAKALWYDSLRNPQLYNDPDSFGKGVCNHFVRTGYCQYGDSCKYYHPKQNSQNLQQTGIPAGDVFRENGGAKLGNLPPSLRPPPEGGYPPLPFVDWG